MNIFESYARAFERYIDFGGRSSRADYWSFVLINIVIFFVFRWMLELTWISQGFFSITLGLYMLGAFIPSLALSIRRLHDSGHSGWWVLLKFIPIANLIPFIFMFFRSEKGVNKYGANPYEVVTETAVQTT